MPSVSAGCIIPARGYSRKALIKFIAVFSVICQPRRIPSIPPALTTGSGVFQDGMLAMRKYQFQVTCPTKCFLSATPQPCPDCDP